jgi:hypothetical protein
MKKLIFIFSICLTAGLTHAQKQTDNSVPAVVRTAFTKLFPSATDVKWSKESASEFEAEFKMGKSEKSANFDQTGKWLGTETEIKAAELPQAVQATISKEFAGYKIGESEKAETSDKGTFYELELVKGKSNLEVQIAADGKVLKKEDKKEKEKKNN